ncbi:MAG TPA: class I SAM-dependent methyltransferase [Ferrovibrio sp.]|uniref:class I SAM-dependent methyltransferase n=1 Tax=Ferrovibrio sp. TaxID=1917215 RepID=UPI002ED2E9D2
MAAIDLSIALKKALDPVFAARLIEIVQPQITAVREDALVLADGRNIPIVNGVPRFVASDHYAASFSFQWTLYRTTQHDEGHQTDFSQKDFELKFGLTQADVAGRLFLDAGCGTGRLSEILAGWGAYVVSVDLSASVDVAHAHLAGADRVAVFQADIGALPFRPESFDFVISSGVLHHTPDTRAYAAKLVPLVKPGGEFAIWVYSPLHAKRKEWIPLTSRLPHPAFQAWCSWIVDIARQNRQNPFLRAVREQFPFTVYHETAARSALTLFDGYTPTYHGVHSEEEVIGWFRDFGLIDIGTNVIPTSVRGRKPAAA